MPRPELAQIKQRHAELTRQLDALEALDVSVNVTDDAMAKQDILDELGKIEHWLWMLESD